MNRTHQFLLCIALLAPLCAQAAPRHTSAAGQSKAVAVAPPARLSPSLASRVKGSSMEWYEANLLTMEGRGWKDTDTTYSRLPARAKAFATGPVWGLSHNTAGLCVRFVTDSTSISAEWDGACDGAMNHMAATGSAGLDLYMRENGKWTYRGTGRPDLTSSTVASVARFLPTSATEYLLYLPLYHKVTGLKIGVDPGSYIAPAKPRAPGDKPIVFYGTSITQGGCASRAGMCHVAILGRWLGRETINLGFSGSGKMEPELAPLFAEIDPALFVLECLPNMTKEMVSERIEPFVKVLREKHPDMPILLVENPLYKRDNPQNVALRAVYDRLRAAGVKNIHLLPADKQLAGKENGTVDGIHPTDLGFVRMAEAYYPTVKALVGGK